MSEYTVHLHMFCMNETDLLDFSEDKKDQNQKRFPIMLSIVIKT